MFPVHERSKATFQLIIYFSTYNSFVYTISKVVSNVSSWLGERVPMIIFESVLG